jgi:hypothetical protein
MAAHGILQNPGPGDSDVETTPAEVTLDALRPGLASSGQAQGIVSNVVN